MNIPYDNPLFLIPASTGVIFVLVGCIMLVFPAKKINSFYGYRTSSSMKSQDRWDFAQHYSSKALIKLGVILALLAMLGFVFQPSENAGTMIGLALMIATVIVLIIRVEMAIQKKFKSE